jgi:peptidoglycan/LPS O-acetylase OafA/YrhL
MTDSKLQVTEISPNRPPPDQSPRGRRMRTTAAPQSDRIAILDGYRAVAISFVLFFHYTVQWAPPRDPSAHLPSGAIFNGFLPFEYGRFGVHLFFVISGFVILMTLTRCRSIGDFVCRRFARLWPALVVAATLTTIFMFMIGPPDWIVSKHDYITSILLINPPIASKLLHQSTIKWVDGAYWSLWIEIRFYVLAAFVYLVARKNFIKVWLALQLAVFAITLLHPEPKIEKLLSLVCFPSFLPYFTLGVCIYAIYAQGVLQRLATTGAVFAACVILYNQVGRDDAIICIIANLIIFALFLLFVIDHPMINIFKRRQVAALGQSSYSLYLIHQYIGVSMMRTCVDLGMPYLLVLPLTIGLVVFGAFLLFFYVEIPAKSWIIRKSQDLLASLERNLPWANYVDRRPL